MGNVFGSVFGFGGQAQSAQGVSFKNLLANGSLRVANNGFIFRVEDEEIETLDRIKAKASDGVLEVRAEYLHSQQEGELTSLLDIFNDGSCLHTYPLDGNANDLAGSDGTWSGNEAYAPLRFGQGADFDGSSYITLPSGLESLFEGDNPFSVSVWFMFKSLSDSWSRIVNFSAKLDITHYSTTDQLVIRHRKNSDYSGYGLIDTDTDFTFSLKENVLYHCVVTFDGDNYAVYINGRKQPITPKWHTSSTPDAPANCIGKSSWSGDALLHGCVDQLRIFNRALTEEEVRKLYVESDYIVKPHLCAYVRDKGEAYILIPYLYILKGWDILPLLDGSGVLSFQFASSKDQSFSVKLQYPDGSLFQSHLFSYNGGGKFQKVIIPIDFSTLDKSKISYPNEALELIIADMIAGDGMDKGDFVRIAEIQLEAGNSASSFENLPYDIEAMRCSV